jgi:hypothetical protein
MTGEKLVLLFNTVSKPELAARVHRSSCPLVTNAARRRGKVIRDEASEEVIADLEDRGYPVKFCKCCKGL